MRKTPSADDLRFAAEWLRHYDDSHDGGKQTKAAEHGVPVAELRKRLAAT